MPLRLRPPSNRLTLPRLSARRTRSPALVVCFRRSGSGIEFVGNRQNLTGPPRPDRLWIEICPRPSRSVARRWRRTASWSRGVERMRITPPPGRVFRTRSPRHRTPAGGFSQLLILSHRRAIRIPPQHIHQLIFPALTSAELLRRPKLRSVSTPLIFPDGSRRRRMRPAQRNRWRSPRYSDYIPIQRCPPLLTGLIRLVRPTRRPHP